MILLPCWTYIPISTCSICTYVVIACCDHAWKINLSKQPPGITTAIKILRLTCIARFPASLVTTWLTCLLKLPRLGKTLCFVWLPFYVSISVEWLALCEKHNNINNMIHSISFKTCGWLVGVVNSYINRVQLPTCRSLSLSLSAQQLCYMLSFFLI